MKQHAKPHLQLFAALVLSVTGGAHAASLQVAPTSVTVQASQNAAGLDLANTGTADLHAQVRVFRWTQVDGEDRLEATRDIAVSPPMAKLAPGAKQLVRIIRLGPPANAEMAYRVIVDELPVDATGNEGKPGLQFMLRYSVPVFVMPAGIEAVAPDLHARVVGDEGRRSLEVRNTGTGHAQLADLAFVDGAGRRTLLGEGLAGYVLAGQSRRWPLPVAIGDAAGGHFETRINGETDVRPLAPGTTR